MKKFTIVFLLIVLAITGSHYVLAADEGYQQPAPNAGDSISDGSGKDSPNGSNSNGLGGFR